MKYTVVIPARYSSTRLPGKPLLNIGAKPMLQHVWERAGASGAERVVIATDDQRILEAAISWGAEVCLTAATHPSGTDRLEEVARQLTLSDQDVVVNVQGDEPFIPPVVIDQVAANLIAYPEAAIATLCEPLPSSDALHDPNVVKVVAAINGRALYFSRAAIPFPRDPHTAAAMDSYPLWRRHIGIYAYRVGFLHRFVTLPIAPTEQLEQLEQLRALHHGEMIHVADACAAVPGGVDTPADLESARAVWAEEDR